MIDVKKPLENANLTVNCEYMDLFDMSSHSERKFILMMKLKLFQLTI